MKNEKTITIGHRMIGSGNPAYIIFEVASTHEKDWQVAKSYVDAAKEVGADAIKFQLFKADILLNPITKGLKVTYDYFKATETPQWWFPKLMKLARASGIDLLCTPFDEDSASFLDSVGLPAFKIASSELTNSLFLARIARFNKPVILSTGMANLGEVSKAVDILRQNGCSQIALLQCVSVYPMPYEDANISAMNTLRDQFNVVVGYSDNGSRGILVPLVAAAMGASIIEKHVTHRKGRGHLDDAFALSIGEFKVMVKRIRNLEEKYAGRLSAATKTLKQEFGDDVSKVIGSSVKEPARWGITRDDGIKMLEVDERQWARRGVFPARRIKKDEVIGENDLIVIRPDIGISVKNLDDVLGLRASENLPEKMPIIIENGQVRRFRKSDIDRVYKDKDLKQFRQILKRDAFLN